MNRPFVYALLSLPKVVNLLLVFIITPLFYKLWNESYSYYITIGVFAGFSTIVAQPVLLRYYEKRNEEESINLTVSIFAFLVLYVFLICVPLSCYLYKIGYSVEENVVCLLFPLTSGMLLLSRAKFYKLSKASEAAFYESVFLIIKIPIGYYLAVSSIITSVLQYAFYFEICCLLEVALLLFVRKEISVDIIESCRRASQLYTRRYYDLIKIIAVALTEVMFGNLDRFTLIATHRSNDLVLYSFALTAATLLYIIPTQINTQSQPMYYNCQNEDDVLHIIRRNIRDLLFVGFVPFTVFLVFGHQFVMLWLGEVIKQEDVTSVYVASVVLMAGAVLNTFCGPFYNYLQSRNKFNLIWSNTTLSTIVFIFLLLLSLNLDGILVIAIASAFSHIVKLGLIVNSVVKNRNSVS